MNYNEQQRKMIWRKYFGSNISAIDVFGRRMTRDNFEADHILPQSLGGRSVIENGIPLASNSNQEKSNYTAGAINGRGFIVQRTYTPGVGELIVMGRRVSW